jgi:hypothetical protein
MPVGNDGLGAKIPALTVTPYRERSVASCTGVDSDLIQFLSIEADCQVSLRHQMLPAGTVGSVPCHNGQSVQYPGLNGVKHLRWRSLRPDGITFRTQINEGWQARQRVAIETSVQPGSQSP